MKPWFLFNLTAFRGNGDTAIELKYAVKVSLMIQFVQLLIIDFQVKWRYSERSSTQANCLSLNFLGIFLETILMAFHFLRPEEVITERAVPMPHIIIFLALIF